MVEELKLAIKIDDASIEQSLLKQFANAQKMADKVVLDFKNVNFDDKQIEAKFKEMQKKAGQNPIDLTIGGNTLDMLGQIDKRLTEIFSIGKGKSFIDSSSTVADIGKIVQNTNNQAKAIDKVTNSYKNQAYELASVLKMLAKLDQYGDVPYAEAFSKAVKSGAKSYKNGDDIQFAAKKYGMDEESIKYLRGLSVNLSNAFNYTDTLGLDTANITDVEKLTEYFRELLKEKLEFNNTKLNTSDIEELIKALGIAKKELFDDGTKSGRNIYGDGTLDKYSDLPQIIQYLKQQETQAIATAEAEQKLAEAQKETVFNTSNSNDSQIEELKSNIQEVKTELGDVKDRISSIESNGFENVRDDVEKTKESVKELNSELAEMKSNLSSTPQESNISSGMKDAFPDKDVSASVESATNSIKEENSVLEQNTQKVKENTQAKEQNTNVNFSKYDKRLDSYNGKIDKYKTTIDRFNDGGWTSNTYLENVQAVKNAVKEYETLLNELKGKDASLVTSDDISKLDNYEKKIKDTIATVTNMSAAEKGYNFVSGQKELDKIHKLLNENSRMSSTAKDKIKAYYAEIESGNPSMSLDKIHGEILKIYNAEVEAGRAGRTLWDTLKNSGFHQIAAQMAGMVGVYDVINLGKEAISTIVSLDDALVDLKKTTAMNETQLEQYYYDANDVAKQMGVTTEEIINQSSAWSRLGYNTAEASTEMAKLSSQFASISPGMEVDEAQSGLVSIMKAWSIDPDQVKSEIMDPINQLGNTMAEDNQDIVEGMERSAAALAAVGTSTKDAFALFSGIQEVLQNAEKSGTSIKSVALRLRSFDETTGEYSEDLANITGELIDLTKTAEHAEGVSIFKPGSTTEFKDLTDYFREIAGIWDEMSQKQQNDFLIKAFGRNQAQAGAALIQNFKAVDKALGEMNESAGSSDKEMEAVESSLSYKINALKETWVGCVQDMIDRGDLGTIVTGLTKVSEGITFVIDKLGILGSIGLGAGIFSGIKNVGIDTLVAY